MNESQVVDSKVVELSLENKDFESNARTSLETLKSIKKELDLSSSVKGIKESEVNVKSLTAGLSALGTGVKTVGSAAELTVGRILKFRLVSEVFDAAQAGISGLIRKFSDLNAATAVTKQIFGVAEAVMELGNVTTQMNAGFEKYTQKTTSVQTIMAATAKNFTEEQRKSGEQMEFVNGQLERLNWFTDETSFKFTDMVNNIGKFTSNNVPLEDSVTAMQGISTWAAKSGANVNEASRAMYNLSQAMAVGTVKLIDWKSIENANMATAEFKQTAIETAEALGELTKVTEDTWKTKSGKEVSVQNFNSQLSEGWFTSEVLMKSLDKYGAFSVKLSEVMDRVEFDTTSELLKLIDDFNDAGQDTSKLEDWSQAVKASGVSAQELKEILVDLGSEENKFGREAFQAAQEAKTWEEAIDSVKDATSTAWMNTFELLFGNYEQAKALYTNIANDLWDVFAGPINDFNDVLEEAFESTGGAITRADWAELEEAGIANPAFIKAVKAAAKAHGISVANIEDDERFLNFVLEKQLLTMDELEWAYNDLYSSAADPEMVGKLAELMSNADEETQTYLDTLKDASSEELANIIFGNGKYEEGYEDLERALDGLLKKLDLSQDEGEAFVAALKETGSIEGAIATLSAYTDEQLRQMGMSDEAIAKARELAEANNDLAAALGEDSTLIASHKSGQELWFESLENGLSIFTNLIETFREVIGGVFPETSASSIYSFVSALSVATGKAAAFVENSQGLRDILGGALSFFNTVATVVGSTLTFAFGRVGKAISPVLKWFGGIASIAGKALTAINKWVSTGQYLKDLAAIFGPALDSVKNKITGLIDAFKNIPFVQNAIKRLTAAFKWFSPDKLAGYFGKLGDKFKEFRDKIVSIGGIKLSNLKEAVGVFKDKVWDYVANFPGFKKLGTAFKSIGSSVVNLLEKPLGIAANKVKGFFGTVKSSLLSLPPIKTVADKFQGFVGNFKSLPIVSNNVKRFKAAFSKAFENFVPYFSKIGGKFKEFKDRITSLGGIKFDKIGSAFSAFKETVLDYISNFPGFKAFGSAFKSFGQSIKSELTKLGIPVDTIKEKLFGFFESVKSAFLSAPESVQKGIEKIKGWFNAFKEIPVVKKNLSRFKMAFSDAFAKVGPHLSGLGSKFKSFFASVKEMGGVKLSNAFNILKSFKDNILDYFVKFPGFGSIRKAFTGLWSDIKDGLKGYGLNVDAITENIKSTFTNMWTAVRTWLVDHGIDVDGIISTVTGVFGVIKDAIGKAIGDLFNPDESDEENPEGKTSLPERIKTVFTNMWTNIKDGLKGFNINIDGFVSSVTGIFGAVKNGFVTAFNAIFNTQDDNTPLIKRVQNAFTALLKNIGNGLNANGINLSSIGETIKSKVLALWEKIKEGFGNLGINFDAIKEKLAPFTSFIESLFTKKVSSDKTQMSGPVQALTTVVTTLEEITGLSDDASKEGENADDSSKDTLSLWDRIYYGLKAFLETAGKIVSLVVEYAKPLAIGVASFVIIPKILKLISGISAYLKGKGKDLKGNAWLKFAGSIAIISASIIAIAWAFAILGERFDLGTLGKAGLALVAVAGVLGVLIWWLSRLKETKNIKNSAKLLKSLAILIGTIAASLFVVSIIPKDRLINAGVAIGGIIFCLGILAAAVGLCKPAFKAVLSMVVILAAVGGALYLLSEFTDPSKVIKIATALSEVLLALGVAMLLLGASGKLGNFEWGTVAKLVVLMTAMLAAVGAVFYLLQRFTDPNKLLPIALSIGTVLIALSASLLILAGGSLMVNDASWAAIGKTILLMVAVLAGVSLALGLLANFTDPKKVIPIAKGLGEVLMAISEAMLILSIASFISNFATGPGIGKLFALIGIIAIIGLVLGAIDGIGKAFGAWGEGDMADFLSDAMDLLYVLCEGVGAAIGALFGSMAGEAISTTMAYLPEIATYIVQFIENLQPLNEMEEVDWTAVIGALATIAGATLVGLIDGLASIVTNYATGKSAVELVASDLVALADGIAHWQETMDEVGKITVDSRGIDKLAGAVLELSFVGLIDGLMSLATQAMTGKTASEQFAADLTTLADAIAHWQEKMDSFGGDITVDGKGISDLAKAVTGINFLGLVSAILTKAAQLFAGTKGKTAMDIFTEDLEKLTNAVSGWQDALGEYGTDYDFNADGISNLAKAVTSINFLGLVSALQTKAAQLISGTKGKSAMDLFTDDLGKLASAVSDWQSAMSEWPEGYSFDTDGISNLATAVTSISFEALKTALLDQIAKHNGLVDEHGGSLITTFGIQLSSLATAIKGWLDILPDDEWATSFPTDMNARIESLGTAITSISFSTLKDQLLEKLDDKIFDAEDPENPKTLIEKFGENLTSLGEAINSYNTVLGGASITVSGEDIKSLTDALDSVQTDGLFTKIKEFFLGVPDFEGFEGNLTDLGSALKAYNDALGDDIDTERFKVAVDAIAALSDFSTYYDEVQSSLKIQNFADQLPILGTKLRELVDTEGLDYDKLSDITGSISKLANAMHTLTLLEIDTGDFSEDETVQSWVDNVNSVVELLSGLKGKDFSGTDSLTGAVTSANAIDLGDAGKDEGKEMVNDAAKSIAGGSGAIADATNTLVSGAAAGINTDAFSAKGVALMVAMADAIRMSTIVQTQAAYIASKAADAAAGYVSNMWEAGKNFAIGFANGITENTYFVRAAALIMVSKAKRAVEEAQQSNSPSKVTQKLGGYFGEGFAIGIDRTGDMVRSSAAGIGSAAKDGLNNAIKSISEVLSSDIDSDPVIRPVLDLSEIQNGASTIGDLLNAGSGPLGISSNFGAISTNLARSRGATTDDVVSALSALKDQLNTGSTNNYNINGITYDDGSNISSAVETLVRAVVVGGRA